LENGDKKNLARDALEMFRRFSHVFFHHDILMAIHPTRVKKKFTTQAHWLLVSFMKN